MTFHCLMVLYLQVFTASPTPRSTRMRRLLATPITSSFRLPLNLKGKDNFCGDITHYTKYIVHISDLFFFTAQSQTGINLSRQKLRCGIPQRQNVLPMEALLNIILICLLATGTAVLTFSRSHLTMKYEMPKSGRPCQICRNLKMAVIRGSWATFWYASRIRGVTFWKRENTQLLWILSSSENIMSY